MHRWKKMKSCPLDLSQTVCSACAWYKIMHHNIKAIQHVETRFMELPHVYTLAHASICIWTFYPLSGACLGKLIEGYQSHAYVFLLMRVWLEFILLLEKLSSKSSVLTGAPHASDNNWASSQRAFRWRGKQSERRRIKLGNEELLEGEKNEGRSIARWCHAKTLGLKVLRWRNWLHDVMMMCMTKSVLRGWRRVRKDLQSLPNNNNHRVLLSRPITELLDRRLFPNL